MICLFVSQSTVVLFWFYLSVVFLNSCMLLSVEATVGSVLIVYRAPLYETFGWVLLKGYAK